MVNTQPRPLKGGGLSETLACSNNYKIESTSIICYHLRVAAHWNDSPVDEDRLYPRRRQPLLYRWWSSFIYRHNCHQYNHCHHLSFFSHLPRTFRWLVSECILEAPIPNRVRFSETVWRERREEPDPALELQLCGKLSTLRRLRLLVHLELNHDNHLR